MVKPLPERGNDTIVLDPTPPVRHLGVLVVTRHT
jgi:hypothetical protein